MVDKGYLYNVCIVQGSSHADLQVFAVEYTDNGSYSEVHVIEGSSSFRRLGKKNPYQQQTDAEELRSSGRLTMLVSEAPEFITDHLTTLFKSAYGDDAEVTVIQDSWRPRYEVGEIQNGYGESIEVVSVTTPPDSVSIDPRDARMHIWYKSASGKSMNEHTLQEFMAGGQARVSQAREELKRLVPGQEFSVKGFIETLGSKGLRPETVLFVVNTNKREGYLEAVDGDRLRVVRI